MPVVYDKADGMRVYVATVLEAAELVEAGTHSFSPSDQASRDEAAEITQEDLTPLELLIRNSKARE